MVGQKLDQLIQFGISIGGNLSDVEHVGVKGGDWVVARAAGVAGFRLSHEIDWMKAPMIQPIKLDCKSPEEQATREREK